MIRKHRRTLSAATLLPMAAGAALLFALPGCESTMSHDKKYRKGGGSDGVPMAVKMRRSTNRGY